MHGIDKVTILKIDKDCHIECEWLDDYVHTIRTICHLHRVRVVSVRMCNSRSKGLHFYVEITPAIDADLANRLQFLLGDDCRRVDFNRARIHSGLNEWNKLFERIGTRPRTIYRHTNYPVDRHLRHTRPVARQSTSLIVSRLSPTFSGTY